MTIEQLLDNSYNRGVTIITRDEMCNLMEMLADNGIVQKTYHHKDKPKICIPYPDLYMIPRDKMVVQYDAMKQRV
jgi:hypothetical protein